MKDDSESDLSQEINDQLSQLWTNSKDKRRQLLSHLTPYSRRNQQSFNSSLAPRAEGENTSFKAGDRSGLEQEVIRLREQLEQQVSQGKHKEMEFDRLKKTAEQLSVEKKYLVRELQQTNLPDENCSKVLNESSILPLSRGKPISTKKPRGKQRKSGKPSKVTIDKTTLNHNQVHQTSKLQDLSRQRLVELVRSTSQYRSYVFYYDSNELSYLKRLQEQHKKNCTKTPGEKEKTRWAPSQIVQDLKVLNMKQQLQLNEEEIEGMIARVKGMFQANCTARVNKIKEGYQSRLQKVNRASQSSVPYELVQVARARERELSRWTKTSSSCLK